MVQRKNNAPPAESSEPFFSSFLKNLKDTLLSNLVGNIKENIKDKIQRIEKKIFRNVTAFLFFLLGMIFVFISIVFFLNYYLHLNYAWGFLISGAGFMLIALIFKWLAKSQ
ncbi:MAG: phage holin family protein [Nanoarchaeota archaeon]